MKTKKTSTKVNYLNKYTCTILVFVVWVSCIDGKYSWIKQYKLTKQLTEMDREKAEVLVKLDDAKKEYDELSNNKEKYAREKYFLSKQGEEVFIIE